MTGPGSPGRGPPRLRLVLYHQGSGERDRTRPRHLLRHRGAPPWRRDHRRHRTGANDVSRCDPCCRTAGIVCRRWTQLVNTLSRFGPTPNRTGVWPLPGAGRHLGASSVLRDLRSCGLLRPVEESTRPGPCGIDRPPGGPIQRASRDVGLVLPARGRDRRRRSRDLGLSRARPIQSPFGARSSAG